MSRLLPRPLLRVLLVVAAAVLLALTPVGPAAADDAGEPPWSPGDGWEPAGSRVDASVAAAPRCDEAREWTWASGAQELVLWTVTCSSDAEAQAMAQWLGLPARERLAVDVIDGEDVADVVGGELLWAWVADHPASADLVLVRSTCDTGGTACAAAIAPEVARLARTVGGDVKEPAYEITSNLLDAIAFPLVLWAVFVAPFRLVSFLARPRYTSRSGSPRYHDVSGAVMAARWRRRVRRAVWALGGFVAVAVVPGIVGGGVSGGLGVAMLGGIVIVLLGLAYWLAPPHAVERGRFGLGGLGARGAAGMALSTLAYGLLPVVAVVYLLAFRYATLLGGWPVTEQAELEGRPEVAVAAFYPLVAPFRDNQLGLIVVVLVPLLLLLLGMDLLGRRLRAASVDDALAQDRRPHYLYLRSFDEDALALPGLLRRRGILGALSLVRRVRFEEVLVRQLSMTGPVIAIAPPGSRLAPIGAARASFSNDEWQQHVARYAQTARAVVMSATPREVRQGFAWEIELVAAHLGHRRVMVVLGPWRRAALARRWQQFCAVVAPIPLFAPIAMPWVPDGVQVLAHSDRQGWQAWGATRRTDWTYSLAVDRATRAYLPDWS